MKFIYRNSDKAVIACGDITVPTGCSSIEIANPTRDGAAILDPGIPLHKVNIGLTDTEDRTEPEIEDEKIKYANGYYLKFDDDIVVSVGQHGKIDILNDGLLFTPDDLPEGFIVNGDVELQDEYGYQKWKYDSGNIVLRTDANKIALFKTDKIVKIKASASGELTILDWKGWRHRDQIDNNETTSLTSEEYTTLLNEKKAIRDKSNNKETSINAETTMAGISSITWDSVE